MDKLPLLLATKLVILKNFFRSLRKRSRLEFATLFLFFLLTGGGLFLFFLQGFRFFQGQEPFGPILLDETFYLLTFVLFLMLIISSGVSSYASLFKSPEVPFLLGRPVTWTQIYFLKLAESVWFSSWGFLFIAVPFIVAYGLSKGAGFLFLPSFCLLFFIPLAVLAGTLGSMAATVTVWLLPGRKHRLVALLAAILCVAWWFIKTQPAMVEEQGSIAGILSGYLPHIAFAKNPFLPSYWATEGILTFGGIKTQAILGRGEGLFFFLVLLSNTCFLIIPSYAIARKLYPRSYFRTYDWGEIGEKRIGHSYRFLEKWADRLKWPSRPALAFLEKDIKTFGRDPSEWSQLIIFFGLLLLYFANLRNLEFHALKAFWKNIVFVLNTVGVYIVLSSFSMRFVFPMLSLEGSKSWILGLTPIRFSSLLLAKFLLGTAASVALTMPLVFFSGWMLEIALSRILFTTVLGFFVCVALTGLSVGLGARFPNFKSNNPTEIISGFGGSLLLVFHLFYLALMAGLLLVIQDPHWLVFWIMAFVSLLTGTLPLKTGAAALNRMEF